MKVLIQKSIQKMKQIQNIQKKKKIIKEQKKILKYTLRKQKMKKTFIK